MGDILTEEFKKLAVESHKDDLSVKPAETAVVVDEITSEFAVPSENTSRNQINLISKVYSKPAHASKSSQKWESEKKKEEELKRLSKEKAIAERYHLASLIKQTVDKINEQMVSLEKNFSQSPEDFWAEKAKLSFKEFTDFVANDRLVKTFLDKHGLSKNELKKFELVGTQVKGSIPLLSTVEMFQDKISDDLVSLILVFCQSFFFTLNYYGYYASFQSLPSTTPSLSSLLLKPDLLQIIFAFTPIVDTILHKYYEWILARSYSIVYFHSFVFLITGNLLYYFSSGKKAETALAMMLGSRLLIGAGGVRQAGQKYFAVMVNEKYRSRVNLLSLATGTIGKTLGPAFASWLLIKSSVDVMVVRDYFPIFCASIMGLLCILYLTLFSADKKGVQKRVDRIVKIDQRQAEDYKQVLELDKKTIKEIAKETKKEESIMQKSKTLVEKIETLKDPTTSGIPEENPLKDLKKTAEESAAVKLFSPLKSSIISLTARNGELRRRCENSHEELLQRHGRVFQTHERVLVRHAHRHESVLRGILHRNTNTQHLLDGGWIHFEARWLDLLVAYRNR